MNYIDYIIIVLLVISAIRGAFKGLIYELASLAALIFGVWGAIKFSAATEVFLTERLNFTSKHIDIIAFVITLLLIIVLIHLIGKAIEKAIESISLGTVNRIFGLIFSVFKTAFLLGIFVILIEKIDETFPIIPEDHIQESQLYTPLRTLSINSFPFLQGFYENLRGKTKDKDKEEQEDKKSTIAL
jgi:membrane protein required for colicin V production